MRDIDIRFVLPADRLPIQRMVELYQHDLSDIWDQDLDCHGEFGYALDCFWGGDGWHALVATVGGYYAGFALVSPEVRIGTEGRWLEQFFVLKKYRRQGVGKHLAETVFGLLPGRWEVGQMPANLAAQQFWREVIGHYTGGRFKEYDKRAAYWTGIVQVFDNT